MQAWRYGWRTPASNLQRRAARAPSEVCTGLAEKGFGAREEARQKVTSADPADLRRARRSLIRRPGASGIVPKRGACYTGYSALRGNGTTNTTI